MRIVTSKNPDFSLVFGQVRERGEADLARVEPVVREILQKVQREGDEAVQLYSEQFDGRRAPKLVTEDFEGRQALERLPPHAREALELAAHRIDQYHRRQLEPGFSYSEEGIDLGMRTRPLARVGVYAPGGKARYPSSVLMSAIPARVAGVREITLATPLAGNQSDDNLLAAAHLAGVTSILNAGGAQAIAAMAYGTKSVSRVDKIVGPGNIYVACAKRLVFGAVAIDSIAGPSEILVIADNESDPEIVAADLLSQAEHDEDAYPLLVCLSEGFAQEVQKCLEQQLAGLPREAIARASVERNGIAFVVESRHRLVEVADAIAAEHLAIHAAEPDWLLQNIDRAGAVFLGTSTPEAAGDYLAGPSHVLPTGGAVRFGSPLGVYDFITRSSIIRYSREALTRHARAISDFARLEGLEAHARAVTVRLRDGR